MPLLDISTLSQRLPVSSVPSPSKTQESEPIYNVKLVKGISSPDAILIDTLKLTLVCSSGVASLLFEKPIVTAWAGPEITSNPIIKTVNISATKSFFLLFAAILTTPFFNLVKNYLYLNIVYYSKVNKQHIVCFHCIKTSRIYIFWNFAWRKEYIEFCSGQRVIPPWPDINSSLPGTDGLFCESYFVAKKQLCLAGEEFRKQGVMCCHKKSLKHHLALQNTKKFIYT